MKLAELPTEDKLVQWYEGLSAAIAWIAAGTNEGNHATSLWTRERLMHLREFLATMPTSDGQ